MTKNLLYLFSFCLSIIVFGQNSITTTSTLTGASTTYTFNLTAGPGGVTWNAVSALVVPGSTLPAFAGNADPSTVANVDVFLNGSSTEAPSYIRNFGNELKIDFASAIAQGTTIKVVIKNVINPSTPANNLMAKIAFQDSGYVDLNSFSTTFNISNTLSTNDSPTAKQIVLYPNPATDYLKLSTFNEKESFKIYNQGGQIVLSGTYTPHQSICIQSLPRGSYILRINDSSYSFIKK